MSPDCVDDEEYGLGSEIHMLSYLDDELFYDVILPRVHLSKIQDKQLEY